MTPIRAESALVTITVDAENRSLDIRDRVRVLFVDDEPLVLEGLRRAVCADFVADLAEGSEEGLAKLRNHGPYHVVVSDLRMPKMDGIGFLTAARDIAPASVRVMLTGFEDVEALGRAVNEGQIFRFLLKPVSREKLVATIRECNAHYQLACIEKDHLKVANEALAQFDIGTLTSLARAIDAKSAWTAGHSERVASVAVKIGQAMGLDAQKLHIIRRGALLHDIGKIGTPASILDKAGELNAEETRIMRDHVAVGVRILEPIPGFRDALPMVAQHHEWFDGTGYLAGLAGENIDLHARILAVADCYDAIISDRPYRKGFTALQALHILQQRSGKQFDPLIIKTFMRISEAGELA
jgi:putative nucleotidyltransferase with HDIG domain